MYNTISTSKRIRLDIIIGIPVSANESAQLTALADDICLSISRISAGCTLTFSEGFWSTDGDQFLQAYENIEKQRNINIHVTVLEDKKKQLLTALKSTMQCHPVVQQLGVRSVHVEIFPVLTEHLSL